MLGGRDDRFQVKRLPRGHRKKLTSSVVLVETAFESILMGPTPLASLIQACVGSGIGDRLGFFIALDRCRRRDRQVKSVSCPRPPPLQLPAEALHGGQQRPNGREIAETTGDRAFIRDVGA